VALSELEGVEEISLSLDRGEVLRHVDGGGKATLSFATRVKGRTMLR
jgi:hypothetical protein